jgi:hypothetical protein
VRGCAVAVDEDLYWRVLAIHESAHACVALYLGIAVLEVRLGDTGIPGAAGYMRPVGAVCDMAVERYLLWLSAAEVAEQRVQPYPGFDFSTSDRATARKVLAVSMLKPPSTEWPSAEAVSTELARWRNHAARLVGKEWTWICRTAVVLVRDCRLSGDEIARLR